MKPSATVQTRRPTATRIRPATAHDLDALDGIYAHARRFMAQTGNPTQWGPNEPSREELAASINAGTLFVGTNEDNARAQPLSLSPRRSPPTSTSIHTVPSLSASRTAQRHRISENELLNARTRHVPAVPPCADTRSMGYS